VIYVLRAVEGIAEFKFVQHTARDVEVLVVPGVGWSDARRREVVAGLAARLGDEVRVTIRGVDHIPPESSGKYRYVVSHVRPDAIRALETVDA
jgi:phenylacetate-CoA ligase